MKSIASVCKMLATLIVLILPLAANAATKSDHLGFDGYAWLKLMLGLILIVGLIFFSMRMIKSVHHRITQNAQLKVLTGINLGTRERLLIIEAADVQLLIGITQGHISKLHEFTTPITLTPQTKPAQENFLSTLQKIMGK